MAEGRRTGRNWGAALLGGSGVIPSLLNLLLVELSVDRGVRIVAVIATVGVLGLIALLVGLHLRQRSRVRSDH